MGADAVRRWAVSDALESSSEHDGVRGASDPLGRAVVRVGLALALGAARTRDDVVAALWDAWDSLDQALMELDATDGSHRVDRSMVVRASLREALASLIEDASVSRAIRWSVVDEARLALEALDIGVDDDCATLADGAERDAIAAYLSTADPSPARLERSLVALWKNIPPPRGRRAALLFDVAERVSAPTRGAILVFAAKQGVDVRGVLAGDSVVSIDARVEALALSARSRTKSPIAWDTNALRSLARMLADWSRFASHPRVLFYRFVRHVGAPAFEAAIAQISQWPLAPEVAGELALHQHKTPSRVIARALGSGRHRCGRCDDEGVRAVRRWADEGDAPDSDHEPATAGEVEYQCAACSLRYWAAWDSATADREPEPEAWVVP